MAISGTFTTTGASPVIVGGKVYVDLTFAGTASVQVQWKVDGSNFRTISTKTTSEQFVVDTGGLPFRLNCSAHTNDVEYSMHVK